MTKEEAIIDIRDNIKPIVVDCISRQAVLDLIADCDLSMGQVVRGIHALPPVTPIRPKGYWIDIDEVHSKCSRCGAVFEICSENGEAKYCPNCGSDIERIHRSI